MLRIYGKALDRLRVRLIMYLVLPNFRVLVSANFLVSF